jgi:hypothetical protein
MKLVTSFSLLLAAPLVSTAAFDPMIRAQVLLARGFGHAMRLCVFTVTVRTTPGYHPVVLTGFHKLLFWRI